MLMYLGDLYGRCEECMAMCVVNDLHTWWTVMRFSQLPELTILSLYSTLEVSSPSNMSSLWVMIVHVHVASHDNMYLCSQSDFLSVSDWWYNYLSLVATSVSITSTLWTSQLVLHFVVKFFILGFTCRVYSDGETVFDKSKDNAESLRSGYEEWMSATRQRHKQNIPWTGGARRTTPGVSLWSTRQTSQELR